MKKYADGGMLPTQPSSAPQSAFGTPGTPPGGLLAAQPGNPGLPQVGVQPLQPTIPYPAGPMVQRPQGFKKGGPVKKYKSGGSVSASRRGDGCATKGKTKGKMR